jgi:hypothetical protein
MTNNYFNRREYYFFGENTKEGTFFGENTKEGTFLPHHQPLPE